MLLGTTDDVNELKFNGRLNNGCLVPDGTVLLKIVLGREGAPVTTRSCQRWDDRELVYPVVWYGILGG